MHASAGNQPGNQPAFLNTAIHRSFFLLLVVLLFPFAAFADQTCCNARVPPAEPRSPRDVVLTTYLDPFVQRECRRLHIPGAVVLIIADDHIVFEKGYGFSNLQTHERMKPNRTLFRMGSISKLFTTTALLQLSEQGKLHLNDDVDSYLKTFRIVNPFPQPVRISDLLTHTAGFDERNLESATLKELEIVPLGKYLAKRMPPVVRPPGALISYSNHGYTLAGYLVELISGMPFEAYVREKILKPLQMDKSTFDLRKELTPDLATGYVFEDKKLQPVPFDYVNDLPADGLVSSAPDMARFLMANLQRGTNDGVQILKPKTMADMQARHFSNHPQLSGWCYGYYEEPRNGVRALMHDGTVYGFTSRICIVPDRHFAFFLATNSDVTTGNLIPAFTATVLDYYFPSAEKIAVPKPPADFLQRARQYEGHYRQTCYSMRTLEKIGLLTGLAPEIQVKANPDRTLLIGRKDYVAVQPMLFEQPNGRAFAAFRKNRAGIVTNVFLEQDAFERIHWYETNRFQMFYAGACLCVFIVALAVWSVKAMLPKVRFTRMDRLSAIISAAHIILVVVVYFTIARRSLFQMTYGVPFVLKLALCLPIVAIVLTALFTLSLIKQWKGISLLNRAYFELFTAAAFAFIWSLHYWNLIGFHY